MSVVSSSTVRTVNGVNPVESRCGLGEGRDTDARRAEGVVFASTDVAELGAGVTNSHTTTQAACARSPTTNAGIDGQIHGVAEITNDGSTNGLRNDDRER